jgi:hypothetical protein
MAPPGRASTRRARSATSDSASSSDRIPATQAAVYSPSEWPITASGTTPRLSHSRASAQPTTNTAGCASAVRFRRSAAGSGARARPSMARRSTPSPASSSAGASPEKSTSRSSVPVGPSSSRQRSTSSRNTGSDP